MACVVRIRCHVARLAVVLLPLIRHGADSGKWVGGFEQGAGVYAPFQAVENGIGRGAEPNYEVVGAHGVAVNRIEHSAAAGADNVMLLGTDLPHDALFDAAKVRFPLGLKKLRYPLLFLLLDFAIGIAEPPVQLPCQDSADGGLSRAR